MKINKGKVILIILLFILILTSFRLIWLGVFNTPEHPTASQGVLDLRDWELDSKRTIRLDGEWAYYPNQFIAFEESEAISSPHYLKVPQEMVLSPGEDTPAIGYGSYRLKILLSDSDVSYGIALQKLKFASEIFINGESKGKYGHPDLSMESYEASYRPYNIIIDNIEGEIELIIHMANYHDPHNGGIIKSIRFGTLDAVETKRFYSVGFQIFLIFVFLLHAFYAMVLFFLSKQKNIIYFFLLMIAASLCVASEDDRILLIWFPISFEWQVKILYLSYVWSAALILKVIEGFAAVKETKRPISFWFLLAAGIYSVLCLLPVTYLFEYHFVFRYLLLLPILIAPFVFFKTLRQNKDFIYLILGGICIVSNIFWPIMLGRIGIDVPVFYPLDFTFAIICLAVYWFKRYFSSVRQTELLAAQLQRSNKLKDDFLANASHELRNPLHAMINMAQSVLHREVQTKGFNEKSTENLHLLIRVGRQMSSMLHDLLDLSQLNENKMLLKRQAIHIRSVAQGVVDMVKYLVEGKTIQLRMEIPENVPLVYADENRVTQILFNLLHNAIKFTDSGYVLLKVEVQGNMLAIYVTDTGIGMDQETQERVLLPYEQGQPSSTYSRGGVGLGLSICHKLIELHEGELTIKSALNQGTSICFTLPLHRTQEQRFDSEKDRVVKLEDKDRASLHRYPVPDKMPDLAELSEISVNPLKQSTEHVAAAAEDVTHSALFDEEVHILLVDDDSINLKIITELLVGKQYRVTSTTRAEKALALLETKQWDLVISDVMMPQMSGYELTKAIRERYTVSELPVLLLTARSRPEDIYAGFVAGANDYVIKPVDALELNYRVQALTAVKKSLYERIRLEAAYLQAQIEPHFLFNTLNSIASLADLDTNKMQQMIEAFSTYLRISFNYWNAEALVPLEHELRLVQSYLHIEQVRFQERLKVVWKIDVDTSIQLPPLSIQPLVENAVKHGILKLARGGIIKINITDTGQNMLITIEDNGKGMDQEQLNQLLEPVNRNKRGIGIYNTHLRLKRLYGTGLTIVSEPGKGTRVSFAIPYPKATH